MIISHGRNYIFVHIPKTGGTAMALALEGRAMRDDIMLGDTPKAKNRRGRVKDVATRGRLWKHSTLADIDGLLRPEEIETMFVFTLVRNPWDRMVSYYHWLRTQRFEHPSVHLARALDFSGFIHDPVIAQSVRSHPYGAYVADAGGTERAALYIRLEHFAADAAPLWEHLGFQLDLPVVNRSERARDYRRYYRGDDSQQVSAICAGDIEKFGYRFE